MRRLVNLGKGLTIKTNQEYSFNHTIDHLEFRRDFPDTINKDLKVKFYEGSKKGPLTPTKVEILDRLKKARRTSIGLRLYEVEGNLVNLKAVPLRDLGIAYQHLSLRIIHSNF